MSTHERPRAVAPKARIPLRIKRADVHRKHRESLALFKIMAFSNLGKRKCSATLRAQPPSGPNA